MFIIVRNNQNTSRDGKLRTPCSLYKDRTEVSLDRWETITDYEQGAAESTKIWTHDKSEVTERSSAAC